MDKSDSRAAASKENEPKTYENPVLKVIETQIDSLEKIPNKSKYEMIKLNNLKEKSKSFREILNGKEVEEEHDIIEGPGTYQGNGQGQISEKN